MPCAPRCGLPLRGPGEGDQGLHGFGDVAVDGSDPDAEGGRELGEGAAAQVCQGLPVRGEPAPAPARPALRAPVGQQAGQVTKR